MAQNQKPGSPSQQNPEEGNEVNPRLKDPTSPGQYRSGVDEEGSSSKKNPGHTNAAHNTPGHERKDQPERPNTAQPGQAKAHDYPGIAGEKARALKENKKAPTDGSADKHVETVHRQADDTNK